jgi:hypothetical protein
VSKAIRALVWAAGTVTAAGGLILSAALPAAAASPNRAYAASASGVVSISPLGEATFPGTSPVSIANANIAGLLTTGVATATAGPASASETINNIGATLSALAGLTATSVTSSCSLNTNTGVVSGTATITNGAVATRLRTITLAANPSVNQTVRVLGIARITLNRQTTAADGTLTVTAIFISLLGSTQTLSIGTSVCNAASLAPVPVLPGMALPLTMGGLALAAAVVTVRTLRRRRRLPVAAR